MKACSRIPPPRLQELCAGAGVSLAALAHEVGLCPDSVRKIAAGRRHPLVTIALQMAEALRVDVEDIFGGADVG